MLKERVVYLDGTYVPWDEAKIHIMSHSVGRGSAIFEVIGFHETATGPAVFRLDEYIARFRNSAALLDMETPLTAAELQEAVLETIRRNGVKQGIIKMMGFYPEIAFQILPPRKRFQVAIFVFDPEGDLGEQAQTGEEKRDGLRFAVAAARPADRSHRGQGGGQLYERDRGQDGGAESRVRLCDPARYAGLSRRGGDRIPLPGPGGASADVVPGDDPGQHHAQDPHRGGGDDGDRDLCRSPGPGGSQ